MRTLTTACMHGGGGGGQKGQKLAYVLRTRPVRKILVEFFQRLKLF